MYPYNSLKKLAVNDNIVILLPKLLLMEMIAFRYGSYAFIQLGKKLNNAKIVVRNAEKEVIQTHVINDKDFLLINIPETQGKVVLELLDNNEIIVKSKV